MKILVAFYSRDGHTKQVGKDIAKILKANVDEIIDLKDRSGIKGWFGGGGDALFKRATKIKFKKDPSKYDLVIIGSPNWAWSVTPAVREYLSKNKFKKLAFFCTYGSTDKNVFRDMQKLGKKPVAIFSCKDKEVGDKDYKKKLKDFCEAIK